MPGIILGRSGVVKVGPLGNAIQGGPTDLREQCLDIPDRYGSVGQHLGHLCFLLRIQLLRSAVFPAPRPGGLESGLGPLPDQCTFKAIL